MSAMQQALLAYGAAAPPSSDYKSVAVDTIGAVATGDLVLLYFCGAGASAPAAPTGWTRHTTFTDVYGYDFALYSSTYAGGNAAANGTNFPVANGFFLTLVYPSPMALLQVGSFAGSASAVISVTVPALASTTGAASYLVLMGSTRDSGSLLDCAGMTEITEDSSPVYFVGAAYEQYGAQSGTRTLAKNTAGSNNTVGILLEVG